MLTVQALSVAGRAPHELDGGASFGLVVLSILLSALSEIAIIRMADEAQGAGGSSGAASLWPAYRAALPRLLPYLATALMAAALTAFGLLLLIVPGLVAMSAFAFWRQSAVLDRSWGSAALLRSALAALPRVWRVLGLITAAGALRLGFFDWAVTFAQLRQEGATALLERYSGLLEAALLGVLVLRVIVDPPILAFFTALYRELAAEGLPVALAAEEELGEDSGEDSGEEPGRGRPDIHIE